MGVNKAFLKQEQKLLKINEDLFDLRLKAFNSQMNPHFIFNALNAIQYFITSGDKVLALEYFSIFSKLIRFYLKHLEKETVCLNEEIKMLHWYLKLQNLRYNDTFHFTLNIDETSKNKNATIPSFITQTLLENIIEHAIYSQYKNNKLTFTFNVSDDEIIFHIVHEYNINKNNTKYIPKYRAKIIEWQKQIQILNKVRPNIIKKIIILSNTQNLKGTILTISLPNLS